MRYLEDVPNMKNALLIIAKLLNEHKITWGLGGSMLLLYYGIQCDVNDIDILIDIDDLDKFRNAIKGFTFTRESGNDEYATAHLYSLEINRVEVDFMIDFRVKQHSGEFVFPFGKDSIEKKFILDGETICLSSLGEWKNAYRAMNRKAKYLLIEAYLGSKNINS